MHLPARLARQGAGLCSALSRGARRMHRTLAFQLPTTIRRDPNKALRLVPCEGPTADRCKTCMRYPCNRMMVDYFDRQAKPYKAHPYVLLAMTAGFYVAFTLEEVPLSGRMRIPLVPGFIAHKINAKDDRAMIASLEPVAMPTDSPEHRFVESVGRRLEEANGLPRMRYFVLDSPEENAFVSAGGVVLVYSGILRLLDSPDRLAVVLGHEMAHFLARHNDERTGVEWIKSALRVFLYTDGNAQAEKAATLAMTLPQSRQVEREADHIGLLLMARACFDPAAAEDAWNTVHNHHNHHSRKDEAEEEVPAEEPAKKVGAAALMALLEDTMDAETLTERLWATHPTHKERIRNFTAGSEWRKEAATYQAHCRCCPRPSDPREQLAQMMPPPLPPMRERRVLPWWWANFERLTELLGGRHDDGAAPAPVASAASAQV